MTWLLAAAAIVLVLLAGSVGLCLWLMPVPHGFGYCPEDAP